MKKKFDCNEVMEQLGEYLDEDARRELCEAIESHLAQCHHCQVQVDTVKKTIVLYQGGEEVVTPVVVSDRLRDALAREYDQRPSD